MKTKFFAALVGIAIATAGCIDTVNGGRTVGVPFVKDKRQASYERPMEQVFQAAKEVISFNGTLIRESVLHGTNSVKTVEGKVKEDTVWVRVEQVDPRITSVIVQTRTPGGGGNLDLASEIDKQIALKLASR